jgi:hypothetical protein
MTPMWGILIEEEKKKVTLMKMDKIIRILEMKNIMWKR